LLTSRQHINGQSSRREMGDSPLGQPCATNIGLSGKRKRERGGGTPRNSRVFTKVQVYFTCVGYFYEAVSVANANSTWERYANSFGDLLTRVHKNINCQLRAGLELNTGELIMLYLDVFLPEFGTVTRFGYL